jgi:hypothetical protein
VRAGELKPPRSTAAPVWGLCQWSSRFPLDASFARTSAGALVCSNDAKGVVVRPRRGELTLAVNSAVEYGPQARAAADPWVHLLAEQDFAAPAGLGDLRAARLHVEARLLRATNRHRGDYSPDRHAAQFQIFFIVQNRNRASPGFGDYLWFGVPLYDSRHRFPEEFKARDFGGTGRFIFTPGGRAFTDRSTHDGRWVTIEKDLLPLLREALETAWARGFLPASRAIGDYALTGMNLGWEVPGTFEVALQIRRLSLRVQRRARRAGNPGRNRLTRAHPPRLMETIVHRTTTPAP